MARGEQHMAGRRSGGDRRTVGRREGSDRRVQVVPVALERRSGLDRRMELDRRAGLDRRIIAERRQGLAARQDPSSIDPSESAGILFSIKRFFGLK